MEGLEPAAVQLDAQGYTHSFVCRIRQRDEQKVWATTPEEKILAARSIFVATGTQPNIAYEFEHRGTFSRLGLHYQHYEEDDTGELTIAQGVEHCKDPDFGPFTSYKKHQHRVSLIGDSHPVFHGNVVKAIASGMRTYPKIVHSLRSKLGQGNPNEYAEFAARMQELFSAEIMQVERKTPSVVELSIKAPLAAKHFKPVNSIVYRILRPMPRICITPYCN